MENTENILNKENIPNKYQEILFVVIFRRTQDKLLYLILKHKLNWKGWEFPKVRVEKQESGIKSIKREIKEKTGQVPYFIKKYPIIGKFKYEKQIDSKPEFVGSKYKLYSAKIKENQVKLNPNKHTDYKWLDFKAAIEYLTWQNQRDSLKIVNEKLEQIFHIKSQKQIPLKKKKKMRNKATGKKDRNKKKTNKIFSRKFRYMKKKTKVRKKR